MAVVEVDMEHDEGGPLRRKCTELEGMSADMVVR